MLRCSRHGQGTQERECLVEHIVRKYMNIMKETTSTLFLQSLLVSPTSTAAKWELTDLLIIFFIIIIIFPGNNRHCHRHQRHHHHHHHHHLMVIPCEWKLFCLMMMTIKDRYRFYQK